MSTVYSCIWEKQNGLGSLRSEQHFNYNGARAM